MALSRKRQPNRTLTYKQKKALLLAVEPGRTKASILRLAGYGRSTIDQPTKVFNSPTFANALEKAGVTDSKVAKRYSRLLNSSQINTMTLDGWKSGRKWQYPKDSEVKNMIEGDEDNPTGCTVLYTRIDTYNHRLIVHYRHPDNATQARIIEMIGKVKSHFAAGKLDIVTHELSEDERKKLAQLNENDA